MKIHNLNLGGISLWLAFTLIACSNGNVDAFGDDTSNGGAGAGGGTNTAGGATGLGGVFSLGGASGGQGVFSSGGQLANGGSSFSFGGALASGGSTNGGNSAGGVSGSTGAGGDSRGGGTNGGALSGGATNGGALNGGATNAGGSAANGGTTHSGGAAGMPGLGGSAGMPGAGGAGGDVFGVGPTCTSGVTWKGGNGATMRPGESCPSCHNFSIAGTVFPTGHEPNDCNGVNSGVTVVITDAKGTTVTMDVNSVGNFYSNTRITTPYTAVVRSSKGTRTMTTPQTSPACNGCHTQNGTNGAPGRIVAP